MDVRPPKCSAVIRTLTGLWEVGRQDIALTSNQVQGHGPGCSKQRWPIVLPGSPVSPTRPLFYLQSSRISKLFCCQISEQRMSLPPIVHLETL